MYHWFLLAKFRPGSGKLDFQEDDLAITESLSTYERRRLFILGSIEFIPVLVGMIAAEFLDSTLWGIVAVVLGLIACIFVCWLFRKKTPLTRIYRCDAEAEDCPWTRQ